MKLCVSSEGKEYGGWTLSGGWGHFYVCGRVENAGMAVFITEGTEETQRFTEKIYKNKIRL